LRKVVDDPDPTTTQKFTFGGNISYTEDHSFALSAGDGHPSSASFVRAEVVGTTPPWLISEKPTPGWRLSGLNCTSATGASSSTTSVSTGDASVRLAAARGSACQFTNRFVPGGSIGLSKVTFGGVVTAGFVIRPVAVPASSDEQSAERPGTSTGWPS
jgi:hypothetical protein